MREIISVCFVVVNVKLFISVFMHPSR